MSLLSSVVSRNTSNPQQISQTFFRRIRRGAIFFIPLVLLVLVAMIWQGWYQQQTALVAGRPLASAQTHLHAVVISRSGAVYLGTHFGLFTSTDGGHTWPQRQGALASTMVTSVAVSPTNPALLAVLAIPTSGISQPAGVYMSADAGKTWHFRNPSGLSSAAYPYRIQAADGAVGHFFVFFSSVGWFETSDLGRHWLLLTTGNLASLQNPSLVTDAHDPAHLLMGGDQGLFETENDGRTWQPVTAVQGSVLSLVATQPTGSQARTLLCATDQELYLGQEQHGQVAWRAVSLSTSGTLTRMVMSADGSALYALFGSDLWFSADLGRTWRHRWHFARSDITSLALNPDHPQTLLAGFFWPGLVLSSTDQGKSWQTLTD